MDPSSDDLAGEARPRELNNRVGDGEASDAVRGSADEIKAGWTPTSCTTR